jgi:AdoMet-dependent heme synthase
MNASLRFERAPRRVYWEMTRACDLACRHCRAEAAPEPDPGELDHAEAARLLERLAGFGEPLPHLIFTGGDPLKRADLFALIEGAQAKGFEVSVAPSGTPLLTAGVIGRLKRAGVAAISLSFDGSDAARHDALRGVPGCFDRTLEVARASSAEGLPFQVNTLVSAETLDDLPAVYRLACDLGAARWSLFFLVSVGRGTVLRPITAEACERLFERLLDMGGGDGAGGAGGRGSGRGPIVTTTEAPHFRRVVLERARRAGRGEAALLRGPMGHGAGIRDGNGIMFISHTGEVWPSGFLPLSAGSVREADPVALYRDSDLFRTLRRADLLGGRCGRCEYAESCGGSRARAFAATGDPMAEDPLCPYQPAPRPSTA